MSKKTLFLSFIIFFLTLTFAFADIEYEVKPKETLSAIARKYGISIKSILEKNSIKDPNNIKAGQIIIIPVEETSLPEVTPAPEAVSTVIPVPSATSVSTVVPIATVTPVISQTPSSVEIQSPPITHGTIPLKHEVKKGETLSSISRKYGVSLQELLDGNSLKNTDSIKIGQILIIPTGFTVEGPIHQVQPKETVCIIAKLYNISVLSLCEANSMGDPNKLKAGRLLVIPEQETVSLQHDNKIGKDAVISDIVVSLKAKPGDDAETVTQTVMGDVVSVSEVSGSWYFITNSDGYIGWVSEKSLAPLDGRFTSSQKVIVSALKADIHISPEMNSDSIGKVVMSTKLPLLQRQNEWVQVLMPQGQIGWLMESQVLFKANPPQGLDKIVETAELYETVPYLWGGTTALGVDCSGFIFTVYKMNGYVIPRDAESQYYYCIKKKDSELKPGDLVFFTTYLEGPSHVGIYLGNRNFIHASSSKGVTVSSLEQDYYRTRYLGGGRIKELGGGVK